MELRTATIGVARVPVCQRIMDYLELAKARLVLMILVVTMVGFYMGSARRTGLGAVAASPAGSSVRGGRLTGAECLYRA